MRVLFNGSELKQVLKDIYALTKIRVVIFDDAFHEIASYPNMHSQYCQLIRNDAEAFKQCNLCDRIACEKAKQSKSYYTYRCHAGLIETVVPIIADQAVIGYMMFGQLVAEEDASLSFLSIQAKLAQYAKIDFVRLKERFIRKKKVSMETIDAMAHVIQIVAQHLYLTRKLTIHKDSFAYQLEHYILEHLHETLDVPTLCQVFHMSKNKLYVLCEQAFNAPIAEHIRLLRIQKAKQLLIDTRDSVSEIASQVGIEDYNYFIKMFKKETLTTPLVFRKNNRLIE